MQESEILPLASYIFGRKNNTSFPQQKDVVTFLSEKLLEALGTVATESPHPTPEEVTSFVIHLHHSLKTHNIGQEESAGYVPLGFLIIFYGRMLSEILTSNYQCHMQRAVAITSRPGQNPSTDAALILLKKDQHNNRFYSRVVYEYKPAIHPNFPSVPLKVTMELLLQCYYVLQSEGLSDILGCITDLNTWHYIALGKNATNKKYIDVKFYHPIIMEFQPTEEEVKSHLEFLAKYLAGSSVT